MNLLDIIKRYPNKITLRPTLREVIGYPNSYARNEAGQIIALHLFSEKGTEGGNFEFQNLEKIVLDENAQYVEFLCLSNNQQLKEVTFTTALPFLTHLYLNDCSLKNITIPKGCKSLKQLYFYSQAKRKGVLEKITFQGDCPNLELLDISNNNISEFELPKVKRGFNELKYLYLQENRLEILTFNQDLPALKILDIRQNKLTKLPSKDIAYTQLETLYVKENPLAGYNSNLINGDNSGNAVGIIADLRALFESGVYLNDRAKLILVGNGRVGKTSLLKRLIGKEYDENEKFTHGISIQSLSKQDFPDVKTDRLDLKVWDFGGQEVYFATHQFFLSDEAVYLYAWTDLAIAEANREKDRIQSPQFKDYHKWREHDYWLSNIRMFTDEPHILVVKTHCHEAKEQFPFTALQETYNLAIPCLDFDAKSSEKQLLALLQSQITNLLNKLPILGREIPNSFNKLLDNLEEEAKKGISEISKQTFADKTVQFKINQKDIDGLLSYLQKTGVIIYFPDNPTLKERIFINPQNLVNRVYRFIEENEQLLKDEGLFEKGDAQNKFGWADCDVLLALLESFELIYKKTESTKYIAPQYLPKLRKSGNHRTIFDGHKQDLTLQYSLHYTRFMPENIMVNVLSHYGPYSQSAVYRNAIYFQHAENREHCIIECIENERVIHVYSKNKIISEEVYKKFIEYGKKAKVDKIIPPSQESILTKIIKKVSPPKKGSKNANKKVLFLAANPDDKEINIDKEYSRIDKMLEKDRKFFKLERQEHTTRKTLLRIADNEKPNIIHFVGHGKKGNPDDPREGGLVLHDNKYRGGRILNAKDTKKLFEDIQEDCAHLEIVILNACYSEPQAKAISELGIYATGTSDEILNETAVNFAEGFYWKYAQTQDVIQSVKWGKKEASDGDKTVASLIHLYHNGKEITI